MAEQTGQLTGRVHASYRRGDGGWSTPVCRGTDRLARSHADHVDSWLRRDAKWRFVPCDCPGDRS